MEATDGDVTVRGAPVSMLVNFAGTYRLGAWTLFAFDEPQPWRSTETMALLASALQRMTASLVLCEGGSEHFSYYPNESLTLGAKVVNLGSTQRAATVRLTVRARSGGAEAYQRSFDLSVPPQEVREVSAEWRPGKLLAEGYIVTCELVQDGAVTDRILHEIGVLEERGRLDPTSLVTVRDGEFVLRGKPWQPHGINYWPLYVAGSEPSRYGLNWLAPGFYQPDEVERDLEQLAGLGMDTLSIQYNDVSWSRNLLDFLRRAGAHGMQVNVFLGPADPMRFDAEATRRFIEAADLASNETVFAYDISWEPRFGGKGAGADLGQYDKQWAAWIVERYGSFENAEHDWSVKCPRREGALTAASDEQLFEDGEHRVMAAAYRRFMADFISHRFRDAVRQIREYDPHHLVSFRTGASVTGGNGRGDYPYDFAAVAKHVDFLCPEGWALRDDARPGGFTTAYCQLVAPQKPVLWAEYGYNVWIPGTQYSFSAVARRRAGSGSGEMSIVSPESIQRERYEDFYRMFLESGAKGAISWWWPGWFRVGEDSDFGICPQDRRPRPVWEVIRKYGAKLVQPRSLPEPDVFVTIDRDAHPAGYHHVFLTKSPEYVRALEAGKRPALRTEGTGTSSANTPLVAVGNTAYDGSNPPKYLNAEFNEVAIKAADGTWVRVADGSVVTVTAGAAIVARASVGNIGEAAWLSPRRHAGPGGVYLSSRLRAGLEFEQPIPDAVQPLGDGLVGEFTLSAGITSETRVAFEMTAKGRAWFGEKLHVTLRPAPR